VTDTGGLSAHFALTSGALVLAIRAVQLNHGHHFVQALTLNWAVVIDRFQPKSVINQLKPNTSPLPTLNFQKISIFRVSTHQSTLRKYETAQTKENATQGWRSAWRADLKKITS
jgi:hypothetical protein